MFEDTMKILTDSVFVETNDYANFTALKTFTVDDPFWNLVYLKKQFRIDDLGTIEKLIVDEKRNYSLYVSKELNLTFKDEILRRGFTELGIDQYLLKNINEKYDLSLTENIKIVELNESDLSEYTESTMECFPEWPNNKLYAETFFNLSLKDNSYKTYLLKEGGKIAAFASVVMKKEIDLAYIHNSGTRINYRRKGYFEILNQYMCDKTLESGINRIYTITEEDSSSFKGFIKKLEFSLVDNYYLYNKSVK